MNDFLLASHAPTFDLGFRSGRDFKEGNSRPGLAGANFPVPEAPGAGIFFLKSQTYISSQA
jgi:hypothetical protein